MKGLVFVTGRYPVDQPGATAVLVRNLFPEPPTEVAGGIIGLGRLTTSNEVSPAIAQVDLTSQYLPRAAKYRVGSKVSRLCLPNHALSIKVQQHLDNRLSVLGDRLATQHVVSLLESSIPIETVLGYAGESLFAGQAAKSAGRRYAVHSQFYHPHTQNALISDAYRSLGFTPPPISQARLERQLATLELADVIWCPSELARQSLVKNGIPSSKTAVSHVGVDVARFHVPNGVRRSTDPFLILFAGNVGLQKGVHVLLEALTIAHLPETTVILNGNADSTARRVIHAYTARLEAKAITVILDPGDPRRYHRRASVFVLPSVHDSFGIVVLEAMAAGLPVIVSDHAGASEIVEHGKHGYVFPSGESGQLAAQIQLLCRDFTLRQELGGASRIEASKYDLARVVNHHRSVLLDPRGEEVGR